MEQNIQMNGTEYTQYTYAYVVNYFLTKKSRIYSGERTASSAKLAKIHIHMQRMKPEFYLVVYMKIN